MHTKKSSKTKPTKSSASTTSSNSTDQRQSSSDHVFSIQNYVLLWLDTSFNPDDSHFQNTIKHLQAIVNDIHVFNDNNECVNFMKTIKSKRVWLLISGRVDQDVLPRIHNSTQLTAIFIFSQNKSTEQSLKTKWSKVRGPFSDLTMLCQSLNREARQFEDNSIGISFFSKNEISSGSLDQLDPSFMYTKLVKEILLELKYDDQNVLDLVTYCRTKYSEDPKLLKEVSEFQQGYNTKSCIQWYSKDCFVYQLLNWALREQELDVIIRLAFFIYDLHHAIKELHSKQLKSFQTKFPVYRGQAMKREQFEKLKQSKGGLLSFNNFLSTSRDEGIALNFALGSQGDSNMVRILFLITIDPSVRSIDFADIEDISEMKWESEILFSMQSVFRIGEIRPNDLHPEIWNIELTFTNDSDAQLNMLAERIRDQIQGPSALYRLSVLLIKLGNFKKAEEVLNTLLSRSADEMERGHLYYQLGQINDNLKEYKKAIEYYQEAATIYHKYLPPNHTNIATCYNNMGLVYDNMRDFKMALKFYEIALKTYKETLGECHPHVATCQNSIGMTHNSLGDYTKALSYCQRAHDVFREKLSPIDPLLATSCNNIGLIYFNMKHYPEAYKWYTQAVEIGEKALPPQHPHLQLFKNNLLSIPKKGNK